MGYLITVVAAYLIGSVPFGYMVGKLFHINIREHGSGNIGFTNVWRVLGIGPGAVVLLLDIGKGYFSCMLGMHLAGVNGCLLAAFAALLGHGFSIFLKFKGGKGVATGGGAVLYMCPIAGLVGIAIIAFCCLVFRYMSVGSISAAVAQPILFYITGAPIQWTIGIFIAASYVIYLHIPNIKRLMNGTENKLGHKKA